MKKRLNDILQDADAKELDTLFGDIDFSDSINKTSMNRITKNVLNKTLTVREKKRSFKYYALRIAIAIVACIVLFVGIYSCITLVNSNIRYKRAIEYMNKNNLVVDGLNGDEIQNVYMDITSGNFSDCKTEEVIKNSLLKIDDKLLITDKLSKSQMENYFLGVISNNVPDLTERIDDENDIYGIFYSRYPLNIINFNKYENDSLKWSVSLDFYDDKRWKLYNVPNAFVLCGIEFNDTIIKVSEDGRIIWNIFISDIAELERCKHNIISVIGYEDGRCDILGVYSDKSDRNYIFSLKLDNNGHVISCENAEHMDSNFKGALAVNGGYLLYGEDAEGTYFLMLNDSCDYLSKVYIGGHDFAGIGASNLKIEDAIIYNDKLYISVTCVLPIGYNSSNYTLLTNVYNTANYAFCNSADSLAVLKIQDYMAKNYIFCVKCDFCKGYKDIKCACTNCRKCDNDQNASYDTYLDYSTEFIEFVAKSIYSAKIIELDLNTFYPIDIFTVYGAYGSSLNIKKDGDLSWNVDSINNIVFYRATNFYDCVEGEVGVVQFDFNENLKENIDIKLYEKEHIFK